MRSEEQLHLSNQDWRGREIALSPELEAAIDQAEAICQKLKPDLKRWEGVPPRPDRYAQAKESMELLAGFSTDILVLDASRWEAFRNRSKMPKLRKELVENVIRLTFLAGGNTWISAAVVELTAFFEFINLQLNPDLTFVDAVALLPNEYVTNMVTGFLNQHVGHGSHKVEADLRSGLDGVNKSCPVSVAPTITVRYFAYTCAEYILMKAIERMI